MRRIRGSGAWFVLIAGLLTLIFVGPVSADSTSKPYSLVISAGNPNYEAAAGEVASGETVGITARLTNETSQQQLGSANLLWPQGFSIPVGTVFAVSPSGSAKVVSDCTLNGAATGPCVEVRNLGLSPGGVATVTMADVSTPACLSGAQPWRAEVKQANNFSGSPGNDLFQDPTTSQPNTTLDGACSLQFGTEPADARTGVAITGTAYTPTAPGVTVVVHDGSGNRVTTSTAPVSMAVGANLTGVAPAPGGTNPEFADGTDGTATFGDLTIAVPGLGYTLVASSGTLGPLGGATSTRFDVQDQVASCSANLDCAVTDATSSQNKSQIVATGTGSGTLVESVFGSSGQATLCGSYKPADPNTYESAYTPNPSTADRSEVITTTFVPTKKLSGSVQQILKGQQICFGDAKQFVTASGALATFTTLPDGKPGYVGLLQTCTGSTVGPCHNRQQDTTVPDPSSPNGFDIVLVADVPVGWADDPAHC